MPYRIEIADLCQKFVESGLHEDMHWYDYLRTDLAQDFDHVVLIQGPDAVDRDHDRIDRAEFGKMGRSQGVVQMTEMGDAYTGGIEDKDRVAVVAGAAEFPHIGRNL